MSHYVIFSDDVDIEMSTGSIRLILKYLKEHAGADKRLSPLVGEKEYDWNSSLKVIPIADLDVEGKLLLVQHLENFLQNLSEISSKWERPEYQTTFREDLKAVLANLT